MVKELKIGVIVKGGNGRTRAIEIDDYYVSQSYVEPHVYQGIVLHRGTREKSLGNYLVLSGDSFQKLLDCSSRDERNS